MYKLALFYKPFCTVIAVAYLLKNRPCLLLPGIFTGLNAASYNLLFISSIASGIILIGYPCSQFVLHAYQAVLTFKLRTVCIATLTVFLTKLLSNSLLPYKGDDYIGLLIHGDLVGTALKS